MGTKTLNRQKPNTVQAQMSQAGWRSLCRKALAAAEAINDRRASGLRVALEKGTEKRTLQVMHIICDADITREFSSPRT
jgi:hypothetical protein